MTNDSDLFETAEALEAAGAYQGRRATATSAATTCGPRSTRAA